MKDEEKGPLQGPQGPFRLTCISSLFLIFYHAHVFLDLMMVITIQTNHLQAHQASA